MWDQEKEHVEKFNELLPKYKVRPTAMLPFWNIAGFALGNISLLNLSFTNLYMYALYSHASFYIIPVLDLRKNPL